MHLCSLARSGRPRVDWLRGSLLFNRVVLTRARPRRRKTPQIRETPDGEIQVHNTVEEEVTSEEEMLGCLERGSLQRATGSTLMNAQSSRSHAIFTVYLDQVSYEQDAGSGHVEGVYPPARARMCMRVHAPVLPRAPRSLMAGLRAEAVMTDQLTSKFHFVDLAGACAASFAPVPTRTDAPLRRF